MIVCRENIMGGDWPIYNPNDYIKPFIIDYKEQENINNKLDKLILIK